MQGNAKNAAPALQRAHPAMGRALLPCCASGCPLRNAAATHRHCRPLQPRQVGRPDARRANDQMMAHTCIHYLAAVVRASLPAEQGTDCSLPGAGFFRSCRVRPHRRNAAQSGFSTSRQRKIRLLPSRFAHPCGAQQLRVRVFFQSTKCITSSVHVQWHTQFSARKEQPCKGITTFQKRHHQKMPLPAPPCPRCLASRCAAHSKFASPWLRPPPSPSTSALFQGRLSPHSKRLTQFQHGSTR